MRLSVTQVTFYFIFDFICARHPWVRGQRSECVFRRVPPRGITLGIGDVVSVTIFEAEAGGLFVPSEAGALPGNFVMLPEQIVDSNGNIPED